MTPDFLLMCQSLNAVVIEGLLAPENRDDTLRDYGTLGLDVLQRWHSELKSQA